MATYRTCPVTGEVTVKVKVVAQPVPPVNMTTLTPAGTASVVHAWVCGRKEATKEKDPDLRKMSNRDGVQT